MGHGWVWRSRVLKGMRARPHMTAACSCRRRLLITYKGVDAFYLLFAGLRVCATELWHKAAGPVLSSTADRADDPAARACAKPRAAGH